MRNVYIDGLRGIAILAVVIIHGLSAFYLTPYNVDFFGYLFRISQQGLRLAVPLLVIISGYVLSESFLTKPLSWGKFIYKRLRALLPGYGYITLVTGLVLTSYPTWRSEFLTKKWWAILFLGRADYHLYFVPMMIGLYLVFIFLFRLIKLKPIEGLGISFLIQTCLYLLIRINPNWPYFNGDQDYYLVFLAWIGYFALGIWSSIYKNKWQNWLFKIKNRLIFGLIALVGGIASFIEGEMMLKAGKNIVEALLTTRLTVMVYCLGWWGICFYPSRLNKIMVTKFAIFGRWSYTIFLTHTLMIRLVGEWFRSANNKLTLIMPTIIYLLALVFWIKIEVRKDKQG